MKKIGKEVLFLSTGEKNPRNGEGSLLRLKDGRILVHIRVQGQGLFTVYQSESLDGGGPSRLRGPSWPIRAVLLPIC